MINLDNFFKPKSVAIIGVSRNPNKIGHVLFRNLLDGGYKGKVYIVNKNADKVLNYKCYKTVLDINERIDLAIIAVPVQFVLETVKECNKKKIKDILIITSGFAEVGDVKLEGELKNYVNKNKIRMIGPNCVAGDTPLLITNDNHTKFKQIGPLIDHYMREYKDKVINMSGTYILDTTYLNKKFKIASYNNDAYRYSKIKKFMKRVGCTDAYNIVLEGGRTLTCSKDHPFFIKRDCEILKTPLRKIKIGDEVPTSVNLPNSGNYVTEINLLNELKKVPLVYRRKLRFFYFGNCRSLNEIKKLDNKEIRKVKIITGGKISLPIFLPISKELCEVLGYFIADGSYKKNACIVAYIEDEETEIRLRNNINKIFDSQLDLKSKKVIKFGSVLGYILFKYIFKIGRGIERKVVPQFIFSLKQDKIAAFLGGLFDGDGGIYIFKNKPKSSIYFDTVSKKILDQVSLLLGILNVGPFYITKRLRENKNIKGVYPNAKDLYELRSDSKQAIAGLHENGFNFLGTKNKKLIGMMSTRLNFSRKFKDNIIYKKIKSIEKINKPVDLYDLEVEKVHNFFAGQILTSNCLGTLDPKNNMDSLFLPRYRLKRPNSGGISFVCQSGAVGSTILDLATERGHKFAKFISYGNATTIDESDIIEYLGKDQDTKVICLYVEAVRNGKKFIDIVSRVSKKKPIIAIKGGITEEGNKATLSHTGSLAGSAEVYFGIFKQVGIIKADNLNEMLNYASIFEKSIRPNGNKVQIITNGGGYGILSTDAISLNKNLQMATLDKKTLFGLKKHLSKLVNVSNPLDLVGDATTENYKLALEYCINDNKVDIILLIVLYQTPLVTTDIVDIITEFSDLHKKPIIIVSAGGEFTEVLSKSLEENNIVTYIFPEDAVKSIGALVEYYNNISS